MFRPVFGLSDQSEGEEKLSILSDSIPPTYKFSVRYDYLHVIDQLREASQSKHLLSTPFAPVLLLLQGHLKLRSPLLVLSSLYK